MFDQQHPFANLRRMMASMTASLLTMTLALGPSGGDRAPGVNPANEHALGRCGYGPRLPLLIVSPCARQNFVDHSVTDQTSITRFVEDNWLGGQRIGQGSFDALANSITQMFNFSKIRHDGTLFLNPSTGEKE